MNDKELRKKNIDVDEMTAIWMPKDWHKIIKERATEEGYPIYKYLMMLSNNHKIYNEK